MRFDTLFRKNNRKIEGSESEGEFKKVRTSCPAHNCGGRCLLVAHIKDGKIIRLDSDDRYYDELDQPRLLACARGKAYLRRQYHPDRLTKPLKRIGKRGEGKFASITWAEALQIATIEINHIVEKYGNQALLVPYGTGAYSNTNGSHLARRLFNYYGGHLDTYNSYSWACTNVATPTVYGTRITGNQRQDWINARYILMWGWNPAEMIDGTNSTYFIKKAREYGAKVICIDPRKTMTAASGSPIAARIAPFCSQASASHSLSGWPMTSASRVSSAASGLPKPRSDSAL